MAQGHLVITNIHNEVQASPIIARSRCVRHLRKTAMKVQLPCKADSCAMSVLVRFRSSREL